MKNTGVLVPSWTGWLTLTSSSSNDSEFQSVVDYLPPINAPVTENATVQEIINISQKASEEVHQAYTLVTFDLGIAKKAYELVWQNQNMYHNVIVRMEVFHTIASYLGTVGKYVTGSGFEEVLIESAICASGSIVKVLSGKHFNRSIRVHKIMVEALERMLLDVFTSSTEGLFFLFFLSLSSQCC